MFEESHILQAVQSICPEAQTVKGSFYAFQGIDDPIRTLYIEFEKKDGSYFSREEFSLFQDELEEELEKAKQERKKREGANKGAEEKPSEDDGVNKAIMNAKKNKENTEVEAKSEDPEKEVDALAEQIKQLIGSNEKQKAVSLYSQVQQIYKNTPKELKAKMLSKCVEIQKMIAGG